MRLNTTLNGLDGQPFYYQGQTALGLNKGTYSPNKPVTVKKTVIKKPVKKVVKKPTAATIAAPVLATTAYQAPQAVPVAAPAKESIFDKLTTIAQQAAPVVLSSVAAARNQKRIDKIQEQRLAAGKEPLTAEEIDRYMDATAPVVKVKGGLDTNTNKYLIVGGLGLVGLLLVMRNKQGAKNG